MSSCQRLPLSVLFQEATIRHLAECLREESCKKAHSALIPVQPRGSLQPFFFLHEDWSGGFYCLKLAQLLGQEQPLYVLADIGFDGRPLLPSVEAMAEENIKHLVAFQPQSPYLLGGFCSGGLVAYEMARQMEQQGIKVGMVILVDAAPFWDIGWLKTFISFGGWLTRLDVDMQARIDARLRRYLLQAPSIYRQGLGKFLTFCLRTAGRDLLRLAGILSQVIGITGPASHDPSGAFARSNSPAFC
jgi:hypothetical protein